MQPDPQRNWFVYHKEKELGPLLETQLLSMLRSGEVDSSAYVYSEGMPDWALLSETGVLMRHPIQNPPAEEPGAFEKLSPTTVVAAPIPEPETKFESLSAPATLATEPPVKTSAESTVVQDAAAAQTAAPVVPKRRWGRLSLAFFLILVGVGCLYYWSQMNAPVSGRHKKAKMSDETIIPVTPGDSNGAKKRPSGASVVNWNELNSVRDSTDPKGPPFRLATKTLGDDRPILVGSVSALVKADSLMVAIFPDDERSLMPVPKLWMLKIPVVDGYFTVGPLTAEGAELPPGRYRFMAALNHVFLGDVFFDVGTWPSSQELDRIGKNIQQERLNLGHKEKTALEMKQHEIEAAVAELKKVSPKLGPVPKTNEWKTDGSLWQQRMVAALAQQRSSLAGPMFYPEAQNKMYQFMLNLMKTYDAVDLYAKGGQKLLLRTRQKTLAQIWIELGQEQSALAGAIQTLADVSTAPPLKINPDLVKQQLTETN